MSDIARPLVERARIRRRRERVLLRLPAIPVIRTGDERFVQACRAGQVATAGDGIGQRLQGERAGVRRRGKADELNRAIGSAARECELEAEESAARALLSELGNG